jgi:hypothetical protein
MAAFFNFNLSIAGALAPRAWVFPIRRAGEIGMFLWIASAVALALVVMAGFLV